MQDVFHNSLFKFMKSFLAVQFLKKGMMKFRNCLETPKIVWEMVSKNASNNQYVYILFLAFFHKVPQIEFHFLFHFLKFRSS